MTKLTTKEQELSMALDILGNKWTAIDIFPAALLATEHLVPFVRYSALKELEAKLYELYITAE